MPDTASAAANAALAARVAELIRDEFAAYNSRFRALTQRTLRHFETRDWTASQAAARQRIELYGECLTRTEGQLHELMSEHIADQALWSLIKHRYAELIEDFIDRELNKTWFNSLARRRFGTVGVNDAVEFVEIERGPIDHVRQRISVRAYPFTTGLGLTCRKILESFPLRAKWRDLGDCAAYLHRELRRNLAARGGTGAIETFEFVEPLFVRSQRAIIVGRVLLTRGAMPLLIALSHEEDGVFVDRVLMRNDLASIVFGYARSYFHADLATVGDTVVFLREILPDKPVEEIYAALGRAKQAKTERYRSIYRFLRRERQARFVEAPGIPGMVMVVFLLPEIDVAFKVMRDRFTPPKKVTHAQVCERYDFIYHHDRAGRLVDAQNFQMLRFRRSRFDAGLLEQLLRDCADRVELVDDHVVLKHVYIERRLDPLNLYLVDSTGPDRRRVIDDYGHAIRDLAMNNIFPGDLLLKNFGVSRHGRVIFYDYDEICPLTECNFRALPRARSELEEFAADVWFDVAPGDVFPEQFVSFLGLSGADLKWFQESHGDLLAPHFWRRTREALLRGQVFDLPPYRGGRGPDPR